MTERRYDPLGRRWVIVSPQRVQRPWQGEHDAPAIPALPQHEPHCHLCPAASRANGQDNPDYRGVYVFDNDFPALAGDATRAYTHGLLRREPVDGRCRVLCYHHRHDLTLGTLPATALQAVIDTWVDEYAMLSRDFDWVQIFENRGRMMGSSSDHPHGQIWASSHLPTLPAVEDAAQREYQQTHGSNMLLDYLQGELADPVRLVTANASWVVLVPYWASWPFETLLLPRRPLADLTAITPVEKQDLAEALQRLLSAYDTLFGVPMPYSMGWHGCGNGRHWQLHAHFYPPLLRSASVRKFMVGYEMLAEAQRDLTPEDAAARLRDQVSGGR
jgi:UDPglucose--hexose-1-phosphate uridylyltransferase